MQQRQLGTADPTVSALGLSCTGMNFAYGSPPPHNEMVALRAAVPSLVPAADVAKAAARTDIHGARCSEAQARTIDR